MTCKHCFKLMYVPYCAYICRLGTFHQIDIDALFAQTQIALCILNTNQINIHLTQWFTLPKTCPIKAFTLGKKFMLVLYNYVLNGLLDFEIDTVYLIQIVTKCKVVGLL